MVTWMKYIWLLLLLPALAGCGRREEPEAAEEKPIIVTVWTDDRHDVWFQEEKIEAYNRSNQDNIKVVYKIYSDNYFQAVNTAFQSNNAPDIMSYNTRIFSDFFGKNYFADIMPYIDGPFKQTFESVMYDGINVIGGRCYFLPTEVTGTRLYYNRGILERVGIESPPATMEELIAASRTITEQLSDEGVYGFAANMKTPKSAIECTILKQGNRELGLKAGYDFANGSYDFSPYAPLLESWRQLLSEDCAYPNCESLDIDPLRQLFAEGKIGMYIYDTHSEAGIYENRLRTDVKWGCTVLPMAADTVIGKQEYTLRHGYLFNGGSKHLEAAWKAYTAIFADTTYLTEYYTSGFGCPIVPEVLKNAEKQGYQPEEEALRILEQDSLWPRNPQEIRSEAVRIKGLDLYHTMKNLIFGNDDIKESLHDLTIRYNEAYQKGITNNIGREIRIDYFDPMYPAGKP